MSCVVSWTIRTLMAGRLAASRPLLAAIAVVLAHLLTLLAVTSPAAAQQPLVAPIPQTITLTIEERAAYQAELKRIESRATELRSTLDQTAHGNPMEIFNGYLPVFIVAFLTTLLVTPLFRRMAIAYGVIDRPDEARKHHKFPIAYMGGVAVYCGMVAAIAFAYLAPLHGLITFHYVSEKHLGPFKDIPYPVPMSILFGMTIVMLIGLWDDVAKVAPLQKVGGQLLAAAALAMNDVGVKVAKQVLLPIGEWVGNKDLIWNIPIPVEIPGLGHSIPIDVIYWTGTAIIAIFVLGACNASNLIDGLDGLLSGVTAICAGGLLVVAIGMAMWDNGPLDAARITLCLALLGACMGFLPHNFNPATIFLGDSGSLLLGYTTIVIVLMLGDTGQTNLVLAGLIIYAIPMIDTALAIIRRKMSGQSISAADDQHLHHILKRKLGVQGAVYVLYLMGFGFAALGILLTMERGRITYALTLVLAAFIGVIAFKVARRKQFEEQAAKLRLSTGQAAGSTTESVATAANVTLPPAGAQGQLPAATPSMVTDGVSSASAVAPPGGV